LINNKKVPNFLHN